MTLKKAAAVLVAAAFLVAGPCFPVTQAAAQVVTNAGAGAAATSSGQAGAAARAVSVGSPLSLQASPAPLSGILPLPAVSPVGLPKPPSAAAPAAEAARPAAAEPSVLPAAPEATPAGVSGAEAAAARLSADPSLRAVRERPADGSPASAAALDSLFERRSAGASDSQEVAGRFGDAASGLSATASDARRAAPAVDAPAPSRGKDSTGSAIGISITKEMLLLAGAAAALMWNSPWGAAWTPAVMLAMTLASHYGARRQGKTINNARLRDYFGAMGVGFLLSAGLIAAIPPVGAFPWLAYAIAPALAAGSALVQHWLHLRTQGNGKDSAGSEAGSWNARRITFVLAGAALGHSAAITTGILGAIFGGLAALPAGIIGGLWAGLAFGEKVLGRTRDNVAIASAVIGLLLGLGGAGAAMWYLAGAGGLAGSLVFSALGAATGYFAARWREQSDGGGKDKSGSEIADPTFWPLVASMISGSLAANLLRQPLLALAMIIVGLGLVSPWVGLLAPVLSVATLLQGRFDLGREAQTFGASGAGMAVSAALAWGFALPFAGTSALLAAGLLVAAGMMQYFARRADRG